MAALHETIFYDVADLVIWPMLTDLSNASPTYGTAIDVPGVAEVGLDPNFTSNSLKGDGRTLATRSRIDDFTFSATYGKLALDVIGTVLTGRAAKDSGSGTTEVARTDIRLPQASPLFAVRFVIDDVDLGLDALIVTAYKALLTGGTLAGSSSDSFGQPTLEASCTQPYHGATLTDAQVNAGTRLVDYTPTVDFALFETMPSATNILV